MASCSLLRNLPPECLYEHERQLAAAVIYQSIHDYLLCGAQSEERRTAEYFLFNKESSLPCWCSMVGLKPLVVRERLKRFQGISIQGGRKNYWTLRKELFDAREE